ncbi:uncharacterized protein [Elaeis guineensis]|uniref:uncharacterized protein n=1 Tax=Elaeis guineensis var. tenera TaxID=51953 RepID=UPI003C6D08C9
MASGNGAGSFQPQLPKFDGKNFERWKIQMEVLFGYQDLMEIIEEGFIEPEATTILSQEEQKILKENRKKNHEALFYIFRAIDSIIFEKVATSKMGKEAWDTLVKSYKGVDKAHKVHFHIFQRQFEHLQMKKSESISDYFSQTLALVNQMKANDEKISDQQIVGKDDRKSTFNNSNRKGRDCKSQERQEKESSKAKDKSPIQCFNCKKYGHYKSQCHSKKGEGRTLRAKVARSTDSGDELERALLFACDVAVENQKNIEFLDTGCSNHMCGQKELFSKLDDTIKSEVKFENNAKISVIGKGYITIKANDGELYKKLDNKSEKCIFISYSTVIKGYRLYNPIMEKPAQAETSIHLQRNQVLPARLQDYVLSRDTDASDKKIIDFALFADCDPKIIAEASRDEDWIHAMDEEIYAIEKNDT